jgi:hypothetical protein
MSVGSRPSAGLSGRHPTLSLAVIAVIVMAGCGSPDSSGPISSPVGASDPPPLIDTESPPGDAVPAAGSSPDGTPPPNAAGQPHADVELEGLIPSEVGGVGLTKTSVTADEFVGAADEPQFATFLSMVERTREDVTLAVAFDPGGSLVGQISALRASGADSDDLLRALLDWYVSADISSMTVGGKQVTVVTVQSDGMVVTEYMYVLDDVAFAVSGADLETAALFLEALP